MLRDEHQHDVRRATALAHQRAQCLLERSPAVDASRYSRRPLHVARVVQAHPADQRAVRCITFSSICSRERPRLGAVSRLSGPDLCPHEGLSRLCCAAMDSYKAEFIEFMVRCEVLRFGDFTAKSGRKTPYFVNAGLYRTGAQLTRLARFYAQALHQELGDDFDVLFGPAYKGIPLAVSTSMVLHQDYGHEVGFCFNRKEAKDHGEGGVLVGHQLARGD